MKLLLTGATGFIGKNLLDALLKSKVEVICYVRKNSDTSYLKEKGIRVYQSRDDINDLIRFLEVEQFCGVVHLASCYLKDHTSEQIENLVESNIKFPLSLLEASCKSKIKWFLNTGTFWQHYESKDYSPVNLYAATKQSFEDLSRYYIENNLINFVNLKLSDTYGVGDTRRKIMNLWLDMIQDDKELNMSPGEQIIDMTYIDDVVSAFMCLINLLDKDELSQNNGKSFGVSSSERITLKSLAGIFEQVSGKKLKINWGFYPYRNREVLKPWDKAIPVPGWKPKILFNDGIKKILSK